MGIFGLMNNLTLNNIRLIGHVGAEPKIKYHDPQTPSATFSLATDAEGSVNEQGVMVRGEVTDWHTILCYRTLAEWVDREVHTGDLLEVVGRLTYVQIWRGEHKRYKAVVLASEIMMHRRKELSDQSEQSPAETLSANPYGEYIETLRQDPDDLPF